MFLIPCLHWAEDRQSRCDWFSGRSRSMGYEMVSDTTLPLTAKGGNPEGESRKSSPSGFSPAKAVAFSKLWGHLALLVVSFLYATLVVSHRFLYTLPGPPAASVLSTARGWLAAAFFLPLAPYIGRESKPAASADILPVDVEGRAPLILVALELALWNFAGNAFFNTGLLFTGAARASFICHSSIIITPLISFLAGEVIRRNVWIGCGLSLAGLALLSFGGGEVAVSDSADEGTQTTEATAISFLKFGTGDLLILGAALCYSILVFRTSSVSKYYPEVSLQAVKTFLQVGLYSTWCAFSAWGRYEARGWDGVEELWGGWRNPLAWAILVYSAAGPGALADVLQQRGQRVVSASEAILIFSSSPVIAAVLAFLLQGEVTSPLENAGGVLIILASMLASKTGSS